MLLMFFIIVIDWVMRNIILDILRGIRWGMFIIFEDLDFVDDIVLFFYFY